jgi:hypothetical protein
MPGLVPGILLSRAQCVPGRDGRTTSPAMTGGGLAGRSAHHANARTKILIPALSGPLIFAAASRTESVISRTSRRSVARARQRARGGAFGGAARFASGRAPSQGAQAGRSQGSPKGGLASPRAPRKSGLPDLRTKNADLGQARDRMRSIPLPFGTQKETVGRGTLTPRAAERCLFRENGIRKAFVNQPVTMHRANSAGCCLRASTSSAALAKANACPDRRT